MTESTDSETVFQRIADELVAANDGVEHGRMMSAPAVTWGGKVFAFYSRRGGPLGMGFRLGRDYEFGTLPVKDWAHLAPFKTKPPMRDWIKVADKDSDHWPQIAELALARMRESG